jgi:DNA-directed RNA polymerase I, II, and III subunit RPABC2
MPGLETIPEEPGRIMPNKYLYTPLIETRTLYVHPDDRITSEVMTDFEYNHIVGIRAQQLANELKSFTEIGDLSDPIEIAKLEIANKRCPLSIRRVRTSLPDRDIAELWDVNEMSYV